MNKVGVVLIGAAILGVGACGGSTPTTPKAADVAKSAGCSNYQSGTVQAFTTETGECTIGDQTLYVMTFPSTKQRDQWMQVGKDGGGTFGEGDLWVIQGDDPATVTKAVKAAGGKIA